MGRKKKETQSEHSCSICEKLFSYEFPSANVQKSIKKLFNLSLSAPSPEVCTSCLFHLELFSDLLDKKAEKNPKKNACFKCKEETDLVVYQLNDLQFDVHCRLFKEAKRVKEVPLCLGCCYKVDSVKKFYKMLLPVCSVIKTPLARLSAERANLWDIKLPDDIDLKSLSGCFVQVNLKTSPKSKKDQKQQTDTSSSSESDLPISNEPSHTEIKSELSTTLETSIIDNAYKRPRNSIMKSENSPRKTPTSLKRVSFKKSPSIIRSGPEQYKSSCSSSSSDEYNPKQQYSKKKTQKEKKDSSDKKVLKKESSFQKTPRLKKSPVKRNLQKDLNALTETNSDSESSIVSENSEENNLGEVNKFKGLKNDVDKRFKKPSIKRNLSELENDSKSDLKSDNSNGKEVKKSKGRPKKIKVDPEKVDDDFENHKDEVIETKRISKKTSTKLKEQFLLEDDNNEEALETNKKRPKKSTQIRAKKMKLDTKKEKLASENKSNENSNFENEKPQDMGKKSLKGKKKNTKKDMEIQSKNEENLEELDCNKIKKSKSKMEVPKTDTLTDELESENCASFSKTENNDDLENGESIEKEENEIDEKVDESYVTENNDNYKTSSDERDERIIDDEENVFDNSKIDDEQTESVENTENVEETHTNLNHNDFEEKLASEKEDLFFDFVKEKQNCIPEDITEIVVEEKLNEGTNSENPSVKSRTPSRKNSEVTETPSQENSVKERDKHKNETSSQENLEKERNNSKNDLSGKERSSHHSHKKKSKKNKDDKREREKDHKDKERSSKHHHHHHHHHKRSKDDKKDDGKKSKRDSTESFEKRPEKDDKTSSTKSQFLKRRQSVYVEDVQLFSDKDSDVIESPSNKKSKKSNENWDSSQSEELFSQQKVGVSGAEFREPDSITVEEAMTSFSQSSETSNLEENKFSSIDDVNSIDLAPYYEEEIILSPETNPLDSNDIEKILEAPGDKVIALLNSSL